MSPTASRLVAGAIRRGNQAWDTANRRARREAARRRFADLGQDVKLHLGCGSNHFPGWVEVDLERKNRPDIVHDLRLGLPAPKASCAFIYSEHLFEHLPLADAERLMRDCVAALRPGGVMRVAMPDLDSLVASYGGNWRDQPWILDHGYGHMSTAAEMLNTAMRDWGHLYVYDFADLSLRLTEAGFAAVQRRPWAESDHSELKGLETREDSLLVVEAVAP